MKGIFKIGLVGMGVSFALFLTISRGATNCANSDGDKYELSITGGKSNVQDGETVSFTVTVDPKETSIIKPVWSLDPVGGGGKGLTKPVITPSADGRSVSIIFFWHDGGGEVLSSTYELKCKTSADCIATKNVTVELPVTMGMTYRKKFDVFILLQKVKDKPNYRMIKGISCDSQFDRIEYKILKTSQFRKKTEIHEEVHKIDFTGGTKSPAAQAGIKMGQKILIKKKYLFAVVKRSWVVDSLLPAFDINIKEAIIGPPGNTTSWMEKRAYKADRKCKPHYFEH